MNKKGAIEFSMTTIMVIIIGVAVLALGLTWIRGTFQQVGTITESALENAETIFGEVAFSGKISAPATINMDRTDAKKFRVLVRNMDSTTPSEYTITATKQGDSCISTISSLGSIKVEPEGVGDIGGGIISNSCSSNNNAIINIEIKEGANVYATDSIAVRIK